RRDGRHRRDQEGPRRGRRDRAPRSDALDRRGRLQRRLGSAAPEMRRILDAFATAFGSLGEHKLRTTLTMLGMMFGVGAVIAMLSIGAGAERQALALIDKLGTRNVVIRSKTFKPDELEEIRKKSIGLSQRDIEAIEEAVPGVEFAAPRVEVEPYKI